MSAAPDVSDNVFVRWLMSWRKAPAASSLPLGVTDVEIAALRTITAAPEWPHYRRVLERLGEDKAAKLASGLPHDEYLFMCGALNAVHAVYTLVDDLVAKSATLQESADARSRNSATARVRTAASFVNSPYHGSTAALDTMARGL